MSFSSFVRSSTLDGIERVMVEGESPLDQFEALQEQIATLAGPSLGKFLCEPLVSEGNGAASTTISWYAAYEGEAVALTVLAQSDRQAAEALLRARIEALQPVIASAPLGQMIAATLYIKDISDVFVISGEPVLTNWGLLSAGAQASNTKRNAAFATGLGALGLALTAPPLAALDFASWRDRLPGSSDLDTPVSEEQAVSADVEDTATAATIPVATVAVSDTLPWYRRAWAPALCATILAAIVLVVLLIPGVLLAPPPTSAAQINDQARLLEDSNQALEERLEQLRNARAEGICTADGTFEVGLPPGGPAPTDDPDTAVDGTAAPGQNAPSPNDESLLPPPLQDLSIPSEGDGVNDAAGLLDVVDSATVLVLAASDDQVGIGSGFFVAPGLVITNDHVIAEGTPGQLYVTSEALGQVIPVEVVARTGISPDSRVDFALLRGDFGDQRLLTISDQVTRLSHVIAAGFPLVVASEDARFRRLLEQNDPAAAPSTSTTRGVVTSIQSQSDGTEVIAHDAEINQGNSGGPLLDLCGRVVGVNTYLLRNEQTNAVARFALHSRVLRQFLDANAVPATYTSDACQPVSNQRAEPPAVPAAVTTEPVAPVEEAPIVEDPAPVVETEEVVEEIPAQDPVEAAPAETEVTEVPSEPEPEPEASAPAPQQAPVTIEASVAPPPERRVSSQAAGLPAGVAGDTGLVSE